MRHFDRITIDGNHTLDRSGAFEVLAEEVYTWGVHQAAPAWPMHQERGQATGAPVIQEHRGAPLISPWISPTQRREWNPRLYEEAVYRLLSQVFAPRTGAALRHELRGRSRIMPHWTRDPVRRVNGQDVYRPNAVAVNSAQMGAVALFTPGHFPARFRACSLFHELVHVARALADVFQQDAARSPGRYTNREEFSAVVIENVYRSETGLPLRWGHSDMNRTLQNPDTWFNHPHNRSAIERLCGEMPGFTRRLAGIPTSFNPFRRHYQQAGLMSAADAN
jgi:hypothetical protein